MTQEELDSLISDVGTLNESSQDELYSQSDFDKEKSSEYILKHSNIWPPPPPDNDHKVIHQLDAITKESEKKASQLFDNVEDISDDFMKLEEKLFTCKQVIENNLHTFTRLSEIYPNIRVFVKAIRKNQDSLFHIQILFEFVSSSIQLLEDIMQIMQYQDIHRQKIERVMGVARTLSNYLNALLEDKKNEIDERLEALILPKKG